MEEALKKETFYPLGYPSFFAHDGRSETPLDATKSSLYETTTRILLLSIRWARNLPSYSSLALQDQVSLLEETWSELFLISCIQWSMPLDSNPLFATMDTNLPINNVQQKKCTQILQKMFARFKMLAVDFSEFACLKAIILFRPGKEVMKRWKNLRDAFYKAEKKAKEDRTSGSQASKRRKYIFNNVLKFFKKIFGKAATTESFTIEEGSRTESEGSLQQLERMEPERSLITEAKEKTVSNIQARRRHKKLDEIDLKILNALEKSAPEKPNSQMSFFHSLLRHTENFDNDEWLSVPSGGSPGHF
ncbi:unnamed protein product [Larinioides sclopetarius]|uniref:NR LBD domain-containing protein n=1 Tax=Larinioides sclopetarius TaxID=280406 RepID=A0AAV1ZQF0_9ARAC